MGNASPAHIMVLVLWDVRPLEHSHQLPQHVIVSVADYFADGSSGVNAGDAPHQDWSDTGVKKSAPQPVANADVLKGRPF